MDESSLRQIFASLGIRATHLSGQGWLNASCPLSPYTHSRGTDRRASFAAHVDDGGPSIYKCQGCHYSGRMSQLVRRLEAFQGRSYGTLAMDCDRADAAGAFGAGFETVRRMAGFEEPEPIDESMVSGVYAPAYSVHAAAAYLANRGVSRVTAELLDLCFDPDDIRVLFPVRGRQGELYGFTGRSILSPEEYPYRSYPKIRDYLGLPKRSLMLGADLYQEGKPVFVIEGLIGYASLIENGVREICNPMALMGSEVTAPKASILGMLGERTYLMPDLDEAGESCLFGHDERDESIGAIVRLQAQGLAVFVPEWPDGKTDPDALTFSEVEDIIRHCPVYRS